MATIFEKNLTAISRYDDELAKKIENIQKVDNNFELSETILKEPNLLYNGISVHSESGADNEALRIFNASKDSPKSVHVIYGLGLGYLLKIFAEKSQGKIILYEPNLEFLRIVMEIVDFSDILQKENIIICSTTEALYQALVILSNRNSNIKLNFLNFHKNLFANDIEAFNQKLSRLYSQTLDGKNFSKNNAMRFLLSTLNGFKNKIEAIPFKELENKAQGIAAIIVSAGPSLHKNLEALKKLENKALIFCIAPALNTILEAKIKPDFINVIEPYDTSSQIKRLNTANLNIIAEPFTNKGFFEIDNKTTFITFSDSSPINKWFSDLTKQDPKGYEANGTVSYQALNCAKLLGCNPIILLGQDLAYTDENCYSKNSPYATLKCRKKANCIKPQIIADDIDEFANALLGNPDIPSELKRQIAQSRIDTLNKSLTLVKSQDGELIPTELGYACFIDYIQDFAEKNTNLELINTSTGGAQIDGFKNISLNDITLNTQKPNVDKFIQNINYEPNINNILKKLKLDSEKCKTALTQSEKGLKETITTKKLLSKHNILDENAIKSIKTTLNFYMDFIQNTIGDNPLLNAACIKEQDMINQHICQTNSTNIIADIPYLTDDLQGFFEITITNISAIAKLLDEINQSLAKNNQIEKI
ncbi:MAG: DUF115 domain-containing protein [Candidatus Gastranaerophilales bacterium]|nr:DUF115 domain-containing protein [Candidatus Gastranaerophilales bacterium]